MCYYLLHKLNKWPHEFLELPRKERAFVIAAVEIRVEDEKKREREIERKSRSRRGRK